MTLHLTTHGLVKDSGIIETLHWMKEVVDDLFEFLSALRNGQAAFSLSTSEKQQNNS